VPSQEGDEFKEAVSISLVWYTPQKNATLTEKNNFLRYKYVDALHITRKLLKPEALQQE
jgi:hypothetical protein